MKKSFNKLCRFSMALMATLWAYGATAAENPRSVASESGARTSRAASRVVSRASGDRARTDGAGISRAATQSKKVVVGRGADSATGMPRSIARQSVIGLTNRSAITAPRSAMTAISRAVVRPFGGATNARSAKRVSDTGLSRAASTARATAVFSDISKIGGGYASCREAYATCMDQFCANANDTFRRCYCSDKFTGFRDTENALDQAKTLLQQFEDNNLNAVDKSAAEVDAMYSATAGEAAIKTDVSGAQSLLNSIGDLLSGKTTKLQTPAQNTSVSMGIMDVDFSTSIDDIWGGGDSGDSLFSGGSSVVDMTALEGQALFNASNKQCVAIISDACENQAMLSMATSAYGIMIAQDCNMYEKNVDKKREQVKQAVRQAEKVLRDARLEEYRAHNSADVNECLTKVRNAIKTDVACGPNYERCLDYSGAYINLSTGEPIYSSRLFQLENLITLDGVGGGDILTQNPNFNAFLDERKMFAKTALDSCRDIADTVWTEFKRTALIEISQAQDEKLEEVRMSCVSTMADCYDTQTGALKAFDTTESQTTGAIAAYASRAMCQEKVVACAMLYAPNDTGKCEFDGNGHIKNGERCGLAALLNFVDIVDNVRVAEGCADAVQKYVNDLCTPSSGDKGFPWNCRQISSRTTKSGNKSRVAVNRAAANQTPVPQETNATTNLSQGGVSNGETASTSKPELDSTYKTEFEVLVKEYAVDRCKDPTSTDNNYSALPSDTKRTVQAIIDDTMEQLESQLMDVCTELKGYWYSDEYNSSNYKNLKPLTAFYSSVYGRSVNNSQIGSGMGACIENTTMVRCLDFNSDEENQIATYNADKDECVFTDDWYKRQCEMIGGYYEGAVCWVEKD